MYQACIFLRIPWWGIIYTENTDCSWVLVGWVLKRRWWFIWVLTAELAGTQDKRHSIRWYWWEAVNLSLQNDHRFQGPVLWIQDYILTSLLSNGNTALIKKAAVQLKKAVSSSRDNSCLYILNIWIYFPLFSFWVTFQNNLSCRYLTSDVCCMRHFSHNTFVFGLPF